MIKYKNGEEYQIRRPNPLMKEQEIWNGYTLHNFFWEDQIRKAKNKKSKIKQEEIKQEEIKQEEIKQEEIKQEEIKQEEIKQEEIKQEEIKQEEIKQEEIKQEEIKQEEIKQEEENLENELIYAMCLFAKNLIEKDEMYNETKSKIKYIKKDLIKIKILEKEDLFFSFYSESKIENNSIIFPKNKDKRWWKIKKEKNKVYECVPSDFTPSFD